jgi:hypothetical protein
MMQTIYIVFENADKTEGRGPMVPVACFLNQKHAKKVANMNEPYGHSGQFCEVREFPLCSNVDDYIDAREEKVRRTALAKLTEEEKKLLGLSQ